MICPQRCFYLQLLKTMHTITSPSNHLAMSVSGECSIGPVAWMSVSGECSIGPVAWTPYLIIALSAFSRGCSPDLRENRRNQRENCFSRSTTTTRRRRIRTNAMPISQPLKHDLLFEQRFTRMPDPARLSHRHRRRGFSIEISRTESSLSLSRLDKAPAAPTERSGA